MRSINQVLGTGALILSCLVFTFACSSIPLLKVNYRLPPPSEELKGMKASLEVLDARSPKVFLGKGTEKEFENFPGDISFSVARYDEPGFKIGLYSPVSMVREGIRRRMENEGLDVLPERTPDAPEVQIALREFSVELVDRKWLVRMDYEARLKGIGKAVSTQAISGQAERFKLVGSGEAGITIEEIFSDMINRLDLMMLFKGAGLVGP